jgi:hypothetical protein
MKQIAKRMSLGLVVLVGLSVVAGCVIHRQAANISLKDLNVEQPVKELALAYPEHFKTPFTLLVLIDENATCGVREIRWWRDWQSHMHQRGWGFLLATTREDSLDLVYAAQLDSVDAPILIVPKCRHYLKELGIFINPINILVDSAGEIEYASSAPMDTAESRIFIEKITELATTAAILK